MKAIELSSKPLGIFLSQENTIQSIGNSRNRDKMLLSSDGCFVHSEQSCGDGSGGETHGDERQSEVHGHEIVPRAVHRHVNYLTKSITK